MSAKDLGTGKEQKITITASSGLSKDEVERMMKDAESHAEEDKKRREEIETRNRADQAVYAAEKMLQEMGDKLPPSTRRRSRSRSRAEEGDRRTTTRGDQPGDGSADADAAQGGGSALQEHGGQQRGPRVQGSAGWAGRSQGSEAPRGSAVRLTAATSSTLKSWMTNRTTVDLGIVDC